MLTSRSLVPAGGGCRVRGKETTTPLTVPRPPLTRFWNAAMSSYKPRQPTQTRQPPHEDETNLPRPLHAAEMFRTIPVAQLCVVRTPGHRVVPKETILTFLQGGQG